MERIIRERNLNKVVREISKSLGVAPRDFKNAALNYNAASYLSEIGVDGIQNFAEGFNSPSAEADGKRDYTQVVPEYEAETPREVLEKMLKSIAPKGDTVDEIVYSMGVSADSLEKELFESTYVDSWEELGTEGAWEWFYNTY